MTPIEWTTVRTLRPNLVIEGQESDVEKTLVAVAGDFRSSMREWGAFEIVHAAAPIVTIIVREVTRLNAVELDRLAQWLDLASPRVQVIVTSTTPIFDAVQQGRFPADLYYRLNTVVLAAAHPGAA